MGRSTALLYLEQGAKVVIADINTEKAKEVIETASTAGHADNIRFIYTDVCEEAQIKAMIDLAVSEFGGLDILFNNAGVGGAMKPITETDAVDWDRTFTLLLRSVFLGIKYGALAMQKSGTGGSIINTSSTAGMGGGSGPVAYSAAKAAIVNLTKNAAVELAPDRIRVNAIAPGGIHTPMVPVPDDAAMKAFMKGKQPWPDTGYGEDIANAALYLASDESRFTTGTTLVVDGGLLAWGPGLFPHTGARNPESGFNMSSAAGAKP
jgi:NAD(P)-dependent dehydrogenase (short-subunit alcohol dehydrogenase family)